MRALAVGAFFALIAKALMHDCKDAGNARACCRAHSFVYSFNIR
jgi:hypothetical protein